MAQQQNQIAGFSTNYFHPSPPPQNSHPRSNDQSNSRKSPRILGGNRKIRETVEEKRIKITEENSAGAEKIKKAARVSKLHRALQTAYDPFMGNMTDSEKREDTLSDEEVAEIVDSYYEDLSKQRDLLLELSRLPPPAFGEEATATLPEPKRVFVPVNELDWPPLDALDGIEEAYAPGTLLSLQLAESFKDSCPIQTQETGNNELNKPKMSRRRDPLKTISKKLPTKKHKAPEPIQTPTTKQDYMTHSWFDPDTALTAMPSVFSASDRFATQSPPSSTSESPKLVQKMNIPAQPLVEFMRQTSVDSQPSTSSQGSSSAKRSKSKKNKVVEEPPLKVSDLENLDKLKMFLNENAPSDVVDKENEELYRKKRGPKNQPSELLVGLLNEANCL